MFILKVTLRRHMATGSARQQVQGVWLRSSPCMTKAVKSNGHQHKNDERPTSLKHKISWTVLVYHLQLNQAWLRTHRLFEPHLHLQAMLNKAGRHLFEKSTGKIIQVSSCYTNLSSVFWSTVKQADHRGFVHEKHYEQTAPDSVERSTHRLAHSLDAFKCGIW